MLLLCSFQSYIGLSNANQVAPSLSMLINRMSDEEFARNGNWKLEDEQRDRIGRIEMIGGLSR